MSIISPLSYTTQKIQRLLDLDTEKIIELMSVTQKDYNSFKDNLDKAPLWAIHSFTSKLGITTENLAKGQLDFEALKEHFSGNTHFIPKKYQSYKHSRFRTIENLLENLDPLCAETILNKLQLNIDHFKNPDGKICGLALIDIQREIRRLGFRNECFENFGYLSSQKYKPIALSQGLSKNMNVKKLYQHVIENIDHNLEKNLTYEVTNKSHDSLLMTVSTRQELKDALKINHFGSVEHCYNVSGWASGLLKFTREQRAEVKKLSCVHQGDQICQYEINYAHSH